MAFPVGLTLVTVHGRIDALPSGGASGQACFTRPYALVGGADNSIVPPRPEYATLDAAGEFTILLPATNDPDWTPVNWAYSVEIISSSGIIRGTLQLDYQSPTVELADLIQLNGAAAVGATYIALSSRGVALGVAALDADGDVNDAAGNKITGGGGGGGTPAGTVVAASGYGQSSTAGAASTYSRGDHSHGTPALGVSSTTAAAGDHTHTDKMSTGGGTGFTMANGGQTAQASSTRMDLGFSNAASGAGVELYKGADGSKPGSIVALFGSVSGGSLLAMHYDALGNYAPRIEVLAAGGVKVYDSSVPSTPSASAVLYSESGALKYINPAGVVTTLGGGGGTAPTFARAYVTSSDIVMPNDAAWAPISGLTLALAAASGDDVEIEMNCMLHSGGGADNFYDLVILVGGSIVRYASTGSGTSNNEGDPALYPSTAVLFHGCTTSWGLTLAPGDVSGGNVTFGLAHKGPGGGVPKVYASPAPGGYPFRWRARNDH
jgi:hypothetical protein